MQNGKKLILAVAAQGASYRLLLSGLDMSPQRLGGPGGREARVQECNHAQGQVFSQRAQRQALKEF
jgi:hypothetical protein